jgi:single-strand DNA-binding protein
MAFSLNKIMLIGNLGKDAENRFTTDNFSITSFSVATNFRYKNKNNEWTDETTWHNVVAFNLSDYFKDYLKKGKKVYVEGRLVSRSYEDKDKIKRTVFEVRADKIIPLESNAEMSKEPSENYGSDTVSPGEVDSEDDLPF